MAEEAEEEAAAATLEETPLQVPEPATEISAGPTGERSDSEDHHQADEDGPTNQQQGGEGATATDPQSLWESIWLAMCPDTRATLSDWHSSESFLLDSQEDDGETAETDLEQSATRRPGNAAGSATLLLRDAEFQIQRWCFRT